MCKKIPIIHQTDCFHNHADPDDHWDLACQFALSYSGDIELKGVLIDYPPKDVVAAVGHGDPAIAAVNQLNYMTGQFVPTAVGYESKVYCDDDIRNVVSQQPLNSGLAMILKTLEDATEPVVVHIVGSARDVAIASMLKPDLFKEKCKAVYLNAGTAVGDFIEWNVQLDPYSYSKLFQLPCPLYWMPCFHSRTPGEGFMINTYGTFWKFQQKRILPHLSQNLQKFFAYALSRSTDNRWLSYLKYDLNKDLIETHGELMRNMWCTAGFLHSAGKTVSTEGKIVEIGTPNVKPVFDFVPIEVTCDNTGRTTWECKDSADRFIFKILNLENYETAMTKALEELLSSIP